MKALFLTLFVALPCWAAVTQEDIDAQVLVVATEQAKLDSLSSLLLAESWQAEVDADSILGATNTQVLVAEKAGGLFDPRYVAVDVAFSEWTAAQKQLWTLGIQIYGQHVTTGITGRYNVRQDRVEGFLGYLKTFIQNTTP